MRRFAAIGNERQKSQGDRFASPPVPNAARRARRARRRVAIQKRPASESARGRLRRRERARARIAADQPRPRAIPRVPARTPRKRRAPRRPRRPRGAPLRTSPRAAAPSRRRRRSPRGCASARDRRPRRASPGFRRGSGEESALPALRQQARQDRRRRARRRAGRVRTARRAPATSRPETRRSARRPRRRGSERFRWDGRCGADGPRADARRAPRSAPKRCGEASSRSRQGWIEKSRTSPSVMPRTARLVCGIQSAVATICGAAASAPSATAAASAPARRRPAARILLESDPERGGDRSPRRS